MRAHGLKVSGWLASCRPIDRDAVSHYRFEDLDEVLVWVANVN
jgi:hypothetical protein